MSNEIKLTYRDNEEIKDFPSVKISQGEAVISLRATDLLELAIASMGMQFPKVLTESSTNVAYNLYKQNFPDVASESYKEGSDEGERLEKFCGKLAQFLFEYSNEQQ